MKSSSESAAQARMAIFDFIEGCYKPICRYSSLGQLSPMELEQIQANRVHARPQSSTKSSQGQSYG